MFQWTEDNKLDFLTVQHLLLMNTCTAWTISSCSWLFSSNSRPWLYDKESWVIAYMVSPYSQKDSANVVVDSWIVILSLGAPCHFQNQTLAESSQRLISRGDTLSSSVGKPCVSTLKNPAVGSLMTNLIRPVLAKDHFTHSVFFHWAEGREGSYREVLLCWTLCTAGLWKLC